MPADTTPADPNRGMLIFCLFALYVVWGSTYLAIRWALQGGFPPFLMAGLRFSLAGLILYTLLRVRGYAHPSVREWGAGALIGTLLLVMGNGGVVFAQQYVPSGVVAIVVGSVPLWAALFGGLFGQWPGNAERWGLAIGFCGLILLNLGSDMSGNGWASFALLVGPITWAFGSIWSRRLPMAQGLMSTATQMLTGGALFLLISFLLGERLTTLPSPRALSAFFYLVLFGSLVAFSAYGYLLRNARPALATSYAYVNPMVAVLLGTFLAGESLSTWGMLAMGAILGSVVLLTRAKR
ncbi:drug/metabolite transporter (DMT)-like permease [Archangium gephyra]|uniref:Drug/metabolite transporter (DMT)-like permease n=2 Tax=Archangium gephyra TaxID=48 RepID=A0AAC8QHK4_9BACT|nr:Permease of the drug/metabolite transporter [Archangium gephyra]REG29582.1 drug/metabolite transporter (DMT)-like permease [Archangium gephyra]